MNTYEIEVKSLLGDHTKAEAFRSSLKKAGATLKGTEHQLNHYFIKGDFDTLSLKILPELSDEQGQKFQAMMNHPGTYSVRTRESDGTVRLVIKCSVDDTGSENGIARYEFDEVVFLSLDKLDTLLLESGFEYQAKWSREREEYMLDDLTITLDRNAGYGWLTEFEIVVDSKEKIKEARSIINRYMESFGIDELNQERLARMFEYYNNNWKEYYGTDNIFVVE
jgi:adenylate cyclase class IV